MSTGQEMLKERESNLRSRWMSHWFTDLTFNLLTAHHRQMLVSFSLPLCCRLLTSESPSVLHARSSHRVVITDLNFALARWMWCSCGLAPPTRKQTAARSPCSRSVTQPETSRCFSWRKNSPPETPGARLVWTRAPITLFWWSHCNDHTHWDGVSSLHSSESCNLTGKCWLTWIWPVTSLEGIEQPVPIET